MRLSVTSSYYQKHRAERRACLAVIAEDIAREARLASIALAEAIAREQHEPEGDLVLVFTYLQLCYYTSRRPASRRLPRAVSLCHSRVPTTAAER